MHSINKNIPFKVDNHLSNDKIKRTNLMMSPFDCHTIFYRHFYHIIFYSPIL